MSRPIFNLGAFLDKERLKIDGSNYTSWFRSSRIVLSPHMMGYVFDAAVGDAPKPDTPNDEQDVYQTKVEDAAFI
jgi:hypothetical protein